MRAFSFAAMLPFAAMFVAPGIARAHVTMTSPAPRYPASEQKDAPCGRAGGARTETVTVFEPGETIVVGWDETVDHASHYRVAFDPDGDDDLAEPVLRDSDWITPAGVQVLADDVEDRAGGGPYAIEVTLPRIECERCTLQLIQVMYGRVDPYYYQCADLALRCAAPGCLDDTSDAGTTDRDGGSSLDAGARPGDAGPRDAALAAADAGPESRDRGAGCGCAVAPRRPGGAPLVVLAMMVVGVLGRTTWRARR